jgi:hypothetical protein
VANLARHSARELLTVLEVAQIARVSERTVWYDIADGCLPTIRADRRVHVPRSALAVYRAVPYLAGEQHLLTVPEVAKRSLLDRLVDEDVAA